MRAISSPKPSRANLNMNVDTLKQFSSILIKPITRFINQSITQGKFPSVGKSAVAASIFKYGDPLSPGNYTARLSVTYLRIQSAVT